VRGACKIQLLFRKVIYYNCLMKKIQLKPCIADIFLLQSFRCTDYGKRGCVRYVLRWWSNPKCDGTMGIWLLRMELEQGKQCA